MICESLGHQVSWFKDAYSALEAIAEGSFDLIVSDYNVIGGDSREFMLKARAKMPNAYMIAASGEQENRDEQMLAGCNEGLSKLDVAIRLGSISSDLQIAKAA